MALVSGTGPVRVIFSPSSVPSQISEPSSDSGSTSLPLESLHIQLFSSDIVSIVACVSSIMFEIVVSSSPSPFRSRLLLIPMMITALFQYPASTVLPLPTSLTSLSRAF